MYDRQTESWWQQATGEAIIGEFAGDSLDFHPSLTLSFAEALETGSIWTGKTLEPIVSVQHFWFSAQAF